MDKFRLPLILFDDRCELCLRFKTSIQRMQGHEVLHFESLYNPDLYLEFSNLSEEECKQKIHLIDEERKVHTGGDALLFIIARLPQASRFTWLLESNMAKKTSEFFYTAVNTYREKVSKSCKSCKDH